MQLYCSHCDTWHTNATPCRTLDLIERCECTQCEDRGYVTRTVEQGEHRVTFTDPCPQCQENHE